RERLIDAVVHHLVDELVKSLHRGVSDVHGGSLADSFQSLQHLDIAGVVAVVGTHPADLLLHRFSRSDSRPAVHAAGVPAELSTRFCLASVAWVAPELPPGATFFLFVEKIGTFCFKCSDVPTFGRQAPGSGLGKRWQDGQPEGLVPMSVLSSLESRSYSVLARLAACSPLTWESARLHLF